MSRTPGLTRILATLGALPFIACAVLPFAGIDELPFLGSSGAIAAAYALTIASFMAGAHWGTALNADTGTPVNLYITSNVVAVAAWLSFLLAPLSLTLVILAALLACLLLVDFRLHRAGIIDGHYWRTRLWITAIVIVALLATAARA